MKIVDGVNLHLIQTNKFKTNHITFRFSGNFNDKSVAKRVLVAQMLATANEEYPTAKKFREKLAQLYGASLSTNVSIKGLVHIVDIDITFIQDKYTFDNTSVLEEIIEFLKSILFKPILSVAQYQPKVFEIEKSNLLSYLESDKEDSFYYSALQSKKLFYSDVNLQVSKYGNTELVSKETAFTSYQEFHKMLFEDQIDIFILGDFDDYRALQLIHQFPFEKRKKDLQFFYEQNYINVVKELVEKKDINQSILDISYHVPTKITSKTYFSLVVLNGMLGGFSHSLLFTNVREKEGLAYTIGSQYDSYTGRISIIAGIDKTEKMKTLQLIIKELNTLKLGKFSVQQVEKTKAMLVNNALLSNDNCKAIIEREYNKMYINQTFIIDNWINEINTVKKIDIIKAANIIKIQSLYFLEGK